MVTAVLADRHPTKLHLFRTYEPTLHLLEDRGLSRENSMEKRDETNNAKEKRRSSKAPQFYSPASPSGRFLQ
jgi:hypothetical protein